MSVVAHSVQFDKICRTCLLVEQNMKSVFDTDCSLGEAHQLFEMLMACTSVQVSKGDGLPTQICLSCISQIARSFSFKKRCENSDSTLREALRKSKIIDNNQCFTERQPFSSDVALHTKEVVTDIDPGILDIKVKLEEDATHIDGLPSKSCLIDSKSIANVSETVYSKCETMMEDAIDLGPVIIKSVCNEDRKPTSTDDPMHEKNDWQKNTLVNNMRMLKSLDETEQQIFPCLDCTACFIDEYDLKIHKETNHNCNVCNKIYADITELRNHILDVHGPKRYFESACAKVFTRSFELGDDPVTHIDAKPFVCQLCNKRFTYQCRLTKHHREKHCNEKTFICAECGKGFAIRGSFISHVRSHTYIKTHTCTICKERCQDSAALTAHRKTHTMVKNFVCSYCGKRFSASSFLIVHERTHTGEKPYVCNVCNKGFRTKGGLEAHLRSHRGEKPHACDVCGKGCTNREKLKIHMRVHTGEKPYQCHLCPKAFSCTPNLKFHIKKHTGERNHICSYCNKGFYNPAILRDHLYIHTGEKPYSCKFCSKSFAQAGTLSRHLKQH